MELLIKNKDRKFSTSLLFFALLLIIFTTEANAGVCKRQVTKILVPKYPAAAFALDISGEVEVSVEINGDGSVARATAISGSKWLKTISEKSALNWRFSSNSGKSKCNNTTSVYFDFILLPKATSLVEESWSFIEYPNRVVVKEVKNPVEIDKDSSPIRGFEVQ